MIDMAAIGGLVIILIITAIIILGVMLMVYGANRVVVRKKYGHLMFWPGGLLVASTLGAMFSLRFGANFATGLVITIIVATLALGASYLMARHDAKS